METFQCNVCSTSCSTLSSYCSHVNVHSENAGAIFKCPVKKCTKKYTYFLSLKNHCYTMHNYVSTRSVPIYILGITFACKFESCRHEKFSTGHEIYTHTIGHLKNSIAIHCPFSDCINKFEAGSTAVQNFRCHVSKYHRGILRVHSNQNNVASSETKDAPISDNPTFAAKINDDCSDVPVAPKIEALRSAEI